MSADKKFLGEGLQELKSVKRAISVRRGSRSFAKEGGLTLSIEYLKEYEGDFMGAENKATLRWLESCIKSAQSRKKEKLANLLEAVKFEITFEIEFASLQNAHCAELCGKNAEN